MAFFPLPQGCHFPMSSPGWHPLIWTRICYDVKIYVFINKYRRHGRTNADNGGFWQPLRRNQDCPLPDSATMPQGSAEPNTHSVDFSRKTCLQKFKKGQKRTWKGCSGGEGECTGGVALSGGGTGKKATGSEAEIPLQPVHKMIQKHQCAQRDTVSHGEPALNPRPIGLLRLEKTLKIIKSNHNLTISP